MGNKKIFLLLSAVISLYLAINPSLVFSYTIDTHAYLTKEIIGFYNKNFPENRIQEKYIPYLIDGSRKEDETPRYLNHFYDPINNIGLHRNAVINPEYIFGTYPSSKEWAESSKLQNNIGYKITHTIASSPSFTLQKMETKTLDTHTDFTWNQALKYWVQGEKEKAMFTLGHILHLIEDASVPAHTRNDVHIIGDPYEQWANKFNLSNSDINLKTRLMNKKPIILSSLGMYFDGIANYSNKNFYSKDTIGIQSGYKEPTPDYEERENGFLVGIKNNKNNENIKLYIKKRQSILSIFNNKYALVILVKKSGGDAVVKNNWNLLSTKDIQYGVGVINLFFKEVEKHKNDPAFTLQNKKSFLGQIINSISNVISSIFNKNKTPVYEVDTSQIQTSQINNIEERKQIKTTSKQKEPENTRAINLNKKSKKQEKNNEQEPNIYTVARVIDGDTIVLNNGDIIRYIGIDTPEMEPKKECYAEQATEDNKKLVLGKKVKLTKANQDKDDYGRLVRYVWIKNILVNEQLLKNGDARAFNFGYKHKKEDEFKKAEIEAKNQKLGLWGEICHPKKKEETSTSTPKKPKKIRATACHFKTTINPIYSPVIINEIAWMGTIHNANDEWIELKNNTNTDIDITNWTLTDKKEQIQVVFGNNNEKTTIPANGYYLLERTDDNSVPNIKADAIYTGTLSNNNEGLRLFNSHCQLIDEAIAVTNWIGGDNSSKKTMERNGNNLGWHTSRNINGTPKTKNTMAYYGGGGSTTIVLGSSGGSSHQGSGDKGDKSNNDDSQKNSTPVILGELRINEIMYNLDGSDSGREWIEIKNIGTSTINISEWKLFEGNSGHLIKPTNNINKINPNEIAVIADNPQKFMADWPEYNGILFDSSFSLKNFGEDIIIKNINDRQTDSFKYTNSIGANGNGKSLQLFNSGWEEAKPTPGKENVKDASQQTIISTPDHIVISEVQISGDNPDDEFIELYNPTDSAISLDGYSIQYISGKATNTTTIYKDNLKSGLSINPLSFLLLANKNGKFSDMADDTYNISLSSNSSGGLIFLVSSSTKIISINDPNITDSLSYGSSNINIPEKADIPKDNQSIERKAIFNGQCVSAIGDGEYLGNSCNSNMPTDFEIREKPTPQNSSSLPEPRQKPKAPENFTTSYSSSTVTIYFSWTQSTSSPTIIYNIIDTNTKNTIATTTSSSTQKRIFEVGKQYSFELSACDSDGLCSENATTTINIPSLLNNFYAYQDPNTNSTSTIVEMFYNKYPFIPNIFEQNKWGLLIFYLNSEPNEQKNIYGSGSSWQVDDTSNVLNVTYQNCVGSNSKRNSLLIPNNTEYCGNAGEAYNSAMKFSDIGEHHMVLHSRPDEHNNYISGGENYITIAIYDTQTTMPSDGRIPYFGLVAVDKTHYKIGVVPQHYAPIMNGDININFDADESKLLLSWQKAIDYDTLPNLIDYQIQTSSSSFWINISKSTSTTLSVSPGDILDISVRAVDEFGNISNTVGPIKWQYPHTDFIIDQLKRDSYSSDFGNKNGTNAEKVIVQKLMFNDAKQFNLMNTILKHNYGSDESLIRLSIYKDSNSMPDMTNEIAHANAHGLGTAGEFPITFRFKNIVNLSSSTPYWLMLRVQFYTYTNSYDVWRRNGWSIPVSSSNSYPNGDYAKMNIESDNKLSDFKIQKNTDWYMKLGIIQ